MQHRIFWMLLLAGSLEGSAFLLGSTASAEPNVASPTPGQPAVQGTVRLPLIGTQKSWTKVCGKDQAANRSVCYTTRDFSAEAGKPPLVAFAVYDTSGNDTKVIRLLLPIGLSLPPGIHLAIDGGAPTNGIFSVCFPKGCFAEAKVTAATVSAMKKGTTLNIGVRNPANADITFAVPLEGFGKAYDGPAIDPKVLQAEQEKIQKSLKEAEDRRKKAAVGNTGTPPRDPK